MPQPDRKNVPGIDAVIEYLDADIERAQEELKRVAALVLDAGRELREEYERVRQRAIDFHALSDEVADGMAEISKRISAYKFSPAGIAARMEADMRQPTGG